MATDLAATAAGEESNLHAFMSALVMIVVSEIGDKTFLIAAIMATRHPRITVFAGAFVSLVIMSVLSAFLGKFILGLIPKVYTLWAAAVLFLVFGIKMLQEARGISPSHMADEMREVEEELEEDDSMHDPSNQRGGVPLEILEEGRVLEDGRPSRGPLDNALSGRSPSASRSGSRSASRAARRARSASPRTGRRNSISRAIDAGTDKAADVADHLRESSRSLLEMMTSPVFAQAFALTFLGEWGDRSQIATIALAGAHSVPVIAFGTIIGHSLCTLLAVMGGRWLSTKLSIRHITFLGAAAFLVFAGLYAVEAYHAASEPPIEI